MDAGFLYALFDDSDVHSLPVRKCVGKIREEIVIPIPAVTETAYFIRKNLGQVALGDFAEDLSNMDILFEAPTTQDYYRTSAVLRKYKDSNLDFVDACIFAIAERLNITKILTIDRRHFSIFRPKHCAAFEILP
jgi:predicted nucleic acid-binding protein